jgi:hypothetical protein
MHTYKFIQLSSGVIFLIFSVTDSYNHGHSGDGHRVTDLDLRPLLKSSITARSPTHRTPVQLAHVESD